MPFLPNLETSTFFSLPRVYLCTNLHSLSCANAAASELGFRCPVSPYKSTFPKAQFSRHHSPAQKLSELPTTFLVQTISQAYYRRISSMGHCLYMLWPSGRLNYCAPEGLHIGEGVGWGLGGPSWVRERYFAGSVASGPWAARFIYPSGQHKLFVGRCSRQSGLTTVKGRPSCLSLAWLLTFPPFCTSKS